MRLMKVTKFTRKALDIRREHRDFMKRGYRRHRTDWEIHSGYRPGEVIQDAQVSADGLYVYTLIGPALE